jgi:hypothetical protein
MYFSLGVPIDPQRAVCEQSAVNVPGRPRQPRMGVPWVWVGKCLARKCAVAAISAPQDGKNCTCTVKVPRRKKGTLKSHHTRCNKPSVIIPFLVLSALSSITVLHPFVVEVLEETCTLQLTMSPIADCSVSRWRPHKVDKRMVREYTHGLFIT